MRQNNNNLTQEDVEKLFEYRDGFLYRKSTGQRSASLTSSSGYYTSSIGRTNFLSHRLIYLLHHGSLPQYIDHINGDKHDNRIENLRAATKAQNGINRPHKKQKRSGKYRGACYHEKARKWHAYINIEGKRKHLGTYETEIEAAHAYDAAAKIHHKEFAVLNFP